MKRHALSALLLLTVLPCQVAAQGICVISERKLPTARGVVLLPNGIPVPEATVELHQNDADGPVVATTTSDAGGHFNFPGIKAGKYVIKASAPMLISLYAPVRVTLKQVPRNRRVELAIIMNGLIGEPCGGGEVELRECTIK